MPFSRILVALAGDAGDRALRAYAALAVSLVPEAAVLDVRAGAPLHDISAADVVLVGPRDAEPDARHWIGELALRAPCSIWMAPPTAPARLTRGLVPVDFSDRSAAALSVASHLVRTAGASRCDVVHVLPVGRRLSFADSDPVQWARTERALTTFIARVDEEGVDVEPVVAESANVPLAIVDTAARRECDLIVLSTRGRSRAAALLLPSVCFGILQVSPLPVLALKRHGAHLGLMQALRDPRLRARGDLRFN